MSLIPVLLLLLCGINLCCAEFKNYKPGDPCGPNGKCGVKFWDDKIGNELVCHKKKCQCGTWRIHNSRCPWIRCGKSGGFTSVRRVWDPDFRYDDVVGRCKFPKGKGCYKKEEHKLPFDECVTGSVCKTTPSNWTRCHIDSTEAPKKGKAGRGVGAISKNKTGTTESSPNEVTTILPPLKDDKQFATTEKSMGGITTLLPPLTTTEKETETMEKSMGESTTIIPSQRDDKELTASETSKVESKNGESTPTPVNNDIVPQRQTTEFSAVKVPSSTDGIKTQEIPQREEFKTTEPPSVDEIEALKLIDEEESSLNEFKSNEPAKTNEFKTTEAPSTDEPEEPEPGYVKPPERAMDASEEVTETVTSRTNEFKSTEPTQTGAFATTEPTQTNESKNNATSSPDGFVDGLKTSPDEFENDEKSSADEFKNSEPSSADGFKTSKTPETTESSVGRKTIVSTTTPDPLIPPDPDIYAP